MPKQSKDATIVELKQQLDHVVGQRDELDKKLKAVESTRDSWYRQMNEHKQSLDAIHDLLDVLPNPVPRKTGTDEMPDYQRKDRTVMERLVAYLVRR